MKLTFYGAAGMVTGSNYLLEAADGTKIMIDCGVRQGGYFVERENFDPFPYDPADVAAVFVTHAHLDHTGRLSKLFIDGFTGPVYSTAPTRDFAEQLLLDSEHLVEKEAQREGKENFCSLASIRTLMDHWHVVDYHRFIEAGPFRITFYDAGHILGSSFILVECEGKKVVFSGDLGNSPAPIVHPTEILHEADYCVIESTYGDRFHESADQRQAQLEDAIEDTVSGGGVLLIPAFAMERTQELLLHLNDLVEKGRVPRVPVFLDSPLAIKLTTIYKKYEDYFNSDTRARVTGGDDIFNFKGLHMTLTTEESKEINHVPAPKIIIAGSGMSQGGRILHHELRYLSDPKSMILFIGYQASGSLGRRIMDGAASVHILGEQVNVACKRRVISAYSAHADQTGLLRWLKTLRSNLQKVFIVHGEQEAGEVLKNKIQDELAVSAFVPEIGQTFVL